MRIIWPSYGDPQPFLVGCETAVFTDDVTWYPVQNMVAGWSPLGDMPEMPLPRTAISWNVLLGFVPGSVGPVRYYHEFVAIPIAGGVRENPVGAIVPEMALSNQVPVMPYPINYDSAQLMEDPQPEMVDETLEKMPSPGVPNATNAFACGFRKKWNAVQGLPRQMTGQIELWVESSSRFVVSGRTLDKDGLTLGACSVVAMETGKVLPSTNPNANPVVATTTSDSSGNYVVQVQKNVPHWLLAYKDGSPDVAGLTVDTVVPAVA